MCQLLVFLGQFPGQNPVTALGRQRHSRPYLQRFIPLYRKIVYLAKIRASYRDGYLARREKEIWTKNGPKFRSKNGPKFRSKNGLKFGTKIIPEIWGKKWYTIRAKITVKNGQKLGLKNGKI